VIDVDSREPIANATLVLVGTTQLNTTSSASGQYQFTNVPAGNYRLEVFAAGYEDFEVDITVASSDISQVVEMVAVVVNTTVSGTVRNSSNSPIPGVNVELSGPVIRQAITTQSGQYQFGDVPPGSYTLIVKLPGYADYGVNFEVAGAPVIHDATLLAVTTVSGFVNRDSRTGPPIEDATVDLISGTTRSTRTDAQGFYQFTNVIEGDYTIEVSHIDYYSGSSQIAVIGAPVTEDFELILGVTVSGFVSDDRTGGAVAGAKVTFTTGGVSFVATTAASGGFSLGKLPQGVYDYRIEAAGYELYEVFGIQLFDPFATFFPSIVPQ
jgi:hypothetical protein